MNLYSATFYYPQEKDKIISQLVRQGGNVYDNLIVVNSYNGLNQKMVKNMLYYIMQKKNYHMRNLVKI